MNWLDWLLLLLIAAGALRGFFKGFIVEVASLLAIVAGIWVAARYNAKVADWIGLGAEHELIAFVITFVGVLILVQLLARVLSKAAGMMLLGLPNKLAGAVFGGLRAAFILSVLVNVLASSAASTGLVEPATFEESRLYPPVAALAPKLVPALADTGWLDKAVGTVRERLDES